MSYYRSGQAYPSSEGNSHAQQPPPTSQHRAARSVADTSHSLDDRDTHSADPFMSSHIAQSWTPPAHLSRSTVHERSYSDQPYPSSPRPPRLHFPSSPPNLPLSAASEASRTAQTPQGPVVPGAYNPQAYAGVVNPSSPTHPGAAFSPLAQTRPTVNYHPNSYRHYEPASYQSVGTTTQSYGIGDGVMGGRHAADHLAQQQIPAPQNIGYPRTMSAESPQQQNYSAHFGSDHASYHTVGSQSTPTPSTQAGQRNSPNVPPRHSARATPVLQTGQFGTSPSQSSGFRSSTNYRHSEATQSGTQGQYGRPAYSSPENYHQQQYQYSQQQSPAATNNTTSLLQRTTTGRHPQSRPLPGPPVNVEPRNRYSHDDTHDNDLHDAAGLAQQDLYEQVENYFDSSPHARSDPRGSRDLQERYDGIDTGGGYLSTGGDSSAVSPVVRREGFRTITRSIHSPRYDEYSDDSDAEAAAGLAAMEIAAQEEAASLRHHGSGNNVRVDGLRNSTSDLQSETDDFRTMDIGSYGGGWDAHLSYGGEPAQLAAGYYDMSQNYQPSRWGESGALDQGDYVPNQFSGRLNDPPSRGAYTVPASNNHSGGFVESTSDRRRLSFDEGDDVEYYEDPTMPGQNMNTGIPDFPYTASGIAARPLPPPPPQEDEIPYTAPAGRWHTPPWVATPSYNFPTTPDSYSHLTVNAANGILPPRSISLTSPPATPQPALPDRAKTDADQRLRKVKRTPSFGVDSVLSGQTPISPQLGLDLPTIPAGRRFQPGKLMIKDFDKCREPWSLSSLTGWLRVITAGESELRTQPLADALQMLFISKVPNMQIADAESLATHVVKTLIDAGILRREEEWLKFEDGAIGGVLPQLTGSGCYALCAHDYDLPGRCYARSCQRTVKRIDSQDEDAQQAVDWATFYKVTKQDTEGVDRKELERQNIIHEIVTTEQTYLDDLTLLQTIYNDGLKNANPPILVPRKLPDFLDQVFGKLDAVQQANGEFLLPQLRYRQKEQGPWITAISDIFRDWIRKAKAAYIDYAANYPQAYHSMKMEEQKNSMFIVFCDQARNNRQARRLGWDTFLKAPITRLQRYGLLLQTVLKSMTNKPEPEITNLQMAMDEIKAVTLECDARVAEQSRKVDLLDIQSKIALRPEMKNVELNITQRGRELLYRGDLQRRGAANVRWLDTHAILLDNYLILAKITPDPSGGPKAVWYDVSKMPIPMDLLSLESADDDLVVKSVRGIPSGPKVSSPTPGNLVHRNTDLSLAQVDSSASSKTLVTSTNLDRGEDKGEKLLYPFRIKHLGRDMYTLYCSRLEDRKNWCEKIIEAKTKHANSLFRQNAEPFSLRVLADTAFAYESPGASSSKRALIPGTPLSRAIVEVEAKYANVSRPSHLCRVRVNCATTFVQQGGKQILAIGTENGVYTAPIGDCRNWTRILLMQKVTQIAVLEEYNLMLLISDKQLIAHHLDVACPPTGAVPQSNSSRNGPQKLSGNKDVGFFAAGRMKDRTLVFYKKKDGLQSTFRILEPVLQKATERRSRLLHRGTTDFFRDYDEFYIPTECTGLELFSTTLAVATNKGFEVLNLDKKTPWTVPDLKQPSVVTIAARLSGVDPLAMFRLSDTEFICVYEECAIYINKHGDVSRSVVMEFVGRAKAASLEAGFLILFDRDFVEIRDAQLGRLKQVIPGVDVRCLDNGRGGSSGGGGSAATITAHGSPHHGSGQNSGAAGSIRTIKFAMQHPEQERVQIVMELVLTQSQGVEP